MFARSHRVWERMHALDGRFRLRGAGVTGALQQPWWWHRTPSPQRRWRHKDLEQDSIMWDAMAPLDLEHDSMTPQVLNLDSTSFTLQRAAGLVPNSLPPE